MTAKLEPQEGLSVLEGLEVKVNLPCSLWMTTHSEYVQVAFGGVWKESLTELSGGQRSLLALSLILSLLLFKVRSSRLDDNMEVYTSYRSAASAHVHFG